MRKSIENEVAVRKTSFNIGGQNKRKIVTAHKESLIATICYLEKYGEINVSDCKENIKAILQRNHYGYFKRIKRGIYIMNDSAKKVLEDKDYKDIVEYYKKEVNQCLK